MDHVLELADVAGPVVLLEPCGVRLCQGGRLYSQPLRHFRDGMCRQERDVVGSGTKRRQREWEHVQPVEQILAEPARADRFGQVLVRGGNDPNVDLARDVLADTLVLPLLQHPQEFGLQFEGKIADLVEKDRAAVRDLEAAGPVAHRARERTAHVTEELALEHLARDGAAVDAHKRPL